MTQKLEERIAYLERMVEDLSDVVTTQGQELTRMGRVVEALRERALAEGEADGGVLIGDERPPHY